MEADVLLARVVVDEADRRVSERRIPEHLAEDQLRRVARSHEEHLLAARDDRVCGGPLDDGSREQAYSHGEREQEEQVDDPDATRDLRRVELEEREHEEGRDHCRNHTAEHAPHVLRRDVAPPAVVEAEDDEDRQRDADDQDDDVPLEVTVVVHGPVAVEADVPGEDPGSDDQRRVDGDLPQPMSIDRRSHRYAGTPSAARTVSTTRSCVSRSMPPHIGSARFSEAACSVSGSAPAS